MLGRCIRISSVLMNRRELTNVSNVSRRVLNDGQAIASVLLKILRSGIKLPEADSVYILPVKTIWYFLWWKPLLHDIPFFPLKISLVTSLRTSTKSSSVLVGGTTSDFKVRLALRRPFILCCLVHASFASTSPLPCPWNAEGRKKLHLSRSLETLPE